VTTADKIVQGGFDETQIASKYEHVYPSVVQ
jgi:hypothetical protein